MDDRALRLRGSDIADRIRRGRLIVVLRRVTPRERLVDLVEELADAGARAFEITFDAPDAAADLAACGDALDRRGHDAIVGAGTVRTGSQVQAAADAGATFIVSPVFDPDVVAATLARSVPVIPGAYTPTEVDRAWRAGATFVKLFPASSLGPAHVRELRGPLPEVETIATGGVDASNARAFLDAGAVAVGIGSALVRAAPAERRAIVELLAGAGSGGSAG
ncbi:MAG TPA: bifunctional 4-hydroxy-2-oxoglutarate aldolase/2-dehydro-3-deoxy-phosphogluconate aldolase [Candidatus Limnocylindrales bacterium]|nr:bifunctional 4-hydroxy-2-oxoglutarate aldolase/2-dehydro-3-deoxy-phosphogluconate aldolase [Candidatus Limnocylindrales bacterium]